MRIEVFITPQAFAEMATFGEDEDGFNAIGLIKQNFSNTGFKHDVSLVLFDGGEEQLNAICSCLKKRGVEGNKKAKWLMVYGLGMKEGPGKYSVVKRYQPRVDTAKKPTVCSPEEDWLEYALASSAQLPIQYIVVSRSLDERGSLTLANNNDSCIDSTLNAGSGNSDSVVCGQVFLRQLAREGFSKVHWPADHKLLYKKYVAHAKKVEFHLPLVPAFEFDPKRFWHKDYQQAGFRPLIAEAAIWEFRKFLEVAAEDTSRRFHPDVPLELVLRVRAKKPFDVCKNAVTIASFLDGLIDPENRDEEGSEHLLLNISGNCVLDVAAVQYPKVGADRVLYVEQGSKRLEVDPGHFAHTASEQSCDSEHGVRKSKFVKAIFKCNGVSKSLSSDFCHGLREMKSEIRGLKLHTELRKNMSLPLSFIFESTANDKTVDCVQTELKAKLLSRLTELSDAWDVDIEEAEEELTRLDVRKPVLSDLRRETLGKFLGRIKQFSFYERKASKGRHEVFQYWFYKDECEKKKHEITEKEVRDHEHHVVHNYFCRPISTGKIKSLTDKGFGFISTEGNGKDMFFHCSACQGVAYHDLHEGQTVTYTVGQGPKGPRAENVQLADD